MSIKLIGMSDTTIDGNGLDDYWYIEGFYPSPSGWCNQIRFKSPGNGFVKVAIYRDSDDARIAKQDTPTAVSAGWNTIMLEAPCYLSSLAVYFLAIISDENIIAYDFVGSGSLEYYKSTTYSGFTFPAFLGGGWGGQSSRKIIIAGWSIDTYDETGKSLVILAQQGLTTQITLSEVEKVQVIVAALGEFDSMGVVHDETGKLQVILALQGSVDDATFLDVGHTVVISAIQGREELSVFMETAKAQIVLALQGSADNATFLEAALEQVILAIQASVDDVIFLDTDLEQVILAVGGSTELVISVETAKLIDILVKQGSWNNLTRLSLDRSRSGGAKKYPLKIYPVKIHPVFGQKED